MNWQKKLKEIVKGRLVLNEPLSRHTTFKIGGKADCWVESKDKADLSNLLRFAKKNKLKVLVVGKGSNLLVKDKGIKGLVINLNQPSFKKIEKSQAKLQVGAGLDLASLINFALKNNLSGVEFLSGIPGTVGGAVLMNAGTRGNCIGVNRYLSIADVITEVKALKPDGTVVTLRKKDLKFSYRYSNVKKFIIIGATLSLKPGSKKVIKKAIDKFWQYKKLRQEWKKPNAGCVFKNPRFDSALKSTQPLLSAGQLIDLCGLKGLERGGAVISRLHANFILNNGNAKAKDVLGLMKIVQSKVKQRFNLNLIPEIKIVGR